jgi:hypothetical protein
MIGLQAQVPSAAALAVRVRTSGLHAGDVQRDAAPGGPLVRTWLMRGTLHLAAADDLGWLLGILAPVVLRASRRRYAELGLDSGTLARAIDVLGRPLEQRPATRAELFAELAARGIDPAGQRGIHLVRHAALNGVLVCGPDQGHEQTWIQRDASATQPVDDREEALAMLARRYHSAYGPAGPRDLAAWAGLPITEAQRAWRLAGDMPGEANGPRGGPSTVRLLPHFDPYLLGYADRDHAVPPEHRHKVWTGGGYVLPTVAVDGLAIGTWRAETRGRRVAVTVTPFEAGWLDAQVSAGIDAEVADLGRFVAREATWSSGQAPAEPRDQIGGAAGH